jgi:hypothetical protein
VQILDLQNEGALLSPVQAQLHKSGKGAGLSDLWRQCRQRRRPALNSQEGEEQSGRLVRYHVDLVQPAADLRGDVLWLICGHNAPGMPQDVEHW